MLLEIELPGSLDSRAQNSREAPRPRSRTDAPYSGAQPGSIAFALNGMAVAKELLAGSHPPKVVFITAQTDPGYVIEAFKAGAAGYVAAHSAASDLAAAIRSVALGGIYLSPVVRSELLDDTGGISSLPEWLAKRLSTPASIGS